MSCGDFAAIGLPNLRPSNSRVVGLSQLFNGTTLVSGLHLAIKGGRWAHWHHGVYLGILKGGHYIADMWGDSKQTARVQHRLLDDFLEGVVSVCIVDYDHDSLRVQNAAVARALKALEDTEWQPLYDAFGSNCECFACWVCTGWYGLEL